MTFISRFSTLSIPRSISPLIPDTSPLFSSHYDLLQFLYRQHNRPLSATLHQTTSQSKPSPPQPLTPFFSSSSSHRFPHPFLVPARTSAPFNPLSALFRSFRTQRELVPSPTFGYRSTQIRPVVPLISKLPKQFFLIPLSFFA